MEMKSYRAYAYSNWRKAASLEDVFVLEESYLLRRSKSSDVFFFLRKLATQLRRVGLNINTERQSCMAADKNSGLECLDTLRQGICLFTLEINRTTKM